MATDVEMANAQSEFDLARVQSAHIVEGQGPDRPPPSNGDSVPADKEPVVQVVLSLPRAEAEKLLRNVESTAANAADGVPAPNSPDTVPAKSASSSRRTSSRLKASEVPNQSPSQPRTTRSSASQSQATSANTNGTESPTLKTSSAALPPATTQSTTPQPQPYTPLPGPPPDVVMNHPIPPSSIEIQGILDTERSYTNAFHKTLSLFVDDKTFSTPSLRAAVVGFLESSNATVLEVLPQHNHVIPEHLRQEIENHVNLIRTVLQRGGVFAEDFLRSRLKKLALHIPRLEGALAAGDPNRPPTTGKAPALVARSNDPYNAGELDPAAAAATQAVLAQAAEAAARSNTRHAQMLQERDGEMNLVEPNGFVGHGPPPPMAGPMPPLPGLSGPGGALGALPPMPRGGKTFVPPSLVPGGPPLVGAPPDGTNSPPPVLAPFDPRPNPMACLFCRQRKIRCIGHKPHPCEICVKRGFVCSYDWISRRGKRKPKAADGSPLEVPPGSVSVAAVDQNGPPTVGGVPIVLPAPGGGAGQGPPPVVGMHQHGQPGLHPIAPIGIPGQEGMVPPFTYTFLPGHPPPGAQFVPGPPPPHHQPPYPPPPHPAPHQEYAGESAAPGERPSPSENGGGMMIDPSLMETTNHGNGNENGNGSTVEGAANGDGGGSDAVACQFCKDQDLPCGGKAPAPCNNCIRRQHECVYEEAQRSGPGRRGKKPAAPVGVGTPSTAPDSPASSTRKSKRMTSEAVAPPAPKKRQRVAPKRGQQAAAQLEENVDEEHEGDADGDVDMAVGGGEEVNGTAA